MNFKLLQSLNFYKKSISFERNIKSEKSNYFSFGEEINLYDYYHL